MGLALSDVSRQDNPTLSRIMAQGAGHHFHLLLCDCVCVNECVCLCFCKFLSASTRRYEGQIVSGFRSAFFKVCLFFYFSQYNCSKNIPWTLKLFFWINFLLKKPCLKFQILPKAQRTRGLSSSYQSKFLRSYYEFLHRACSNFIFRILTKKQL